MTSKREAPEDPKADEPPMWRQWMLFYQQKRTHLSIERRFLAWIRTSLSLVTIGFVIQRIELFVDAQKIDDGTLPVSAAWIPPAFFLLAALIVVLATYDFFAERRSIRVGATRVSGPLNVLVMALLLVLLGGSVLLLLPSL